MGFLKDMRTLNKQAKEISKDWDPAAQMRDGMARMQDAQQMLARQTAAAQLAATGEPAEAQVIGVRDTGALLNMQPVLEIDLLVTRTGMPPYPATVRQVVAHAQLARLTPGATLHVRVDPDDPATVLLGV